jgi:hypothetical protein
MCQYATIMVAAGCIIIIIIIIIIMLPNQAIASEDKRTGIGLELTNFSAIPLQVGGKPHMVVLFKS